MNELTFEVGRHYRTRDGEKMVVMLIRERYMVCEDNDGRCFVYTPDGMYFALKTSFDLVAEWREPERVVTKMYRHSATGVVRVHSEFLPDCGWELIAQHELVEGEGMG